MTSITSPGSTSEPQLRGYPVPLLTEPPHDDHVGIELA